MRVAIYSCVSTTKREQKPGVHFDEQVYPTLEASRSGAMAEDHAQIRAMIEHSLGEVKG